MNLIDELDGRLVNLWKFWSVRWNVVSAACMSTVTAYEGFKATDAGLVRWVPEQIIGVLVLMALISIFGAILARGVLQPKLRDVDPDNNSEHA